MDQPTEPSPPAITAEKPDRTINVDLARDVLAATFETMRIRPNEDPAHLHIREAATYTALTSLHASDPIELMFAAHAVASHHATMECFRRAMCATNNSDAAARMQSANNLHQIGLACHNFNDTEGTLPLQWTPWWGPGGIMQDSWPADTSTHILLLPFFEQDNLYRRWDNDDNRNNVAGGTNAVQAQVFKLLLCPSDPLPQPVVYFNAARAASWTWGYYGLSSYGGNGGTRSFSLPYSQITQDGIFFPDSSVRLADVADGTSLTFLFGERCHRDAQFDLQQPILSPDTTPIGQYGRWACIGGWGTLLNVELSTPVRINYQVPAGGDSSTLEVRGCAFGSGHPGGANFAFADGSVRFVSDSIPLLKLQALSTRAGGEVVSGGDF